MKVELPALFALALVGGAAAFSPAVTTRRSVALSPPVGYYKGKVSIATYATVEKGKQKKQVDEASPAAKFSDPEEPEILGKPIPYSELTIGVLKETFPGENRVSQTPDSIKSLVKEGFTVVVESGGKLFLVYYFFTMPPVLFRLHWLINHIFRKIAGERASFSDAAYVEAGAIVLQREQIFNDADIITKIRPPSDDEVPKLAGKTLISTIQPAINGELYQKLTEQKTNVFALDCVPRMLSRGQSYDTLSRYVLE